MSPRRQGRISWINQLPILYPVHPHANLCLTCFPFQCELYTAYQTNNNNFANDSRGMMEKGKQHVSKVFAMFTAIGLKRTCQHFNYLTTSFIHLFVTPFVTNLLYVIATLLSTTDSGDHHEIHLFCSRFYNVIRLNLSSIHVLQSILVSYFK